jgi:predicted transcriptional regulator
LRKGRKLTEDQVRKIRKLDKDREMYREMALNLSRRKLAEKFGVSQSVIWSVTNYAAYIDVE